MRQLFVLFIAVLLSGSAGAQITINLNSNLDQQPIWGPTGYDHVEYYYLPDVDAYYYVPQKVFYYSEGGRWIGRPVLPPRYRSFDFYNSYKVVVNEPTPYLNDKTYRVKYVSYKGRHDQQLIRDSRDAKYYVIKQHPEHKNWAKQQKHEKRGKK